MRNAFNVLILAALGLSIPFGAKADEPVTLMGKVSPWMYPKASMDIAEMSDGATIDGDGNRTVASIVCKSTMKTKDPVEKVLAFYKAKLAPPKQTDAAKRALTNGRSVVISDDSGGRDMSLHTILINTPKTSTTLIISRAGGAKETHIHWKHYARL